MKNITRPSAATVLFVLTLLFVLFFAPALRAQILLQEDFDAAALGAPPAGWSVFGNSVNVDPGQACSGNAVRMNQFASATINSLDSPDLLRGSTPGNVAVSFDLRVADWNDNSQLTGTGQVYAQLIVEGVFVEDFVSIVNLVHTPGCEPARRTFTTAEIPLGSMFEIRFLGIWSSGDWSYVIDNVDVRVVNDECDQAVLLPQTTRPAGVVDGNVVDGSLQGATQSQSACAGTANDDIWYRFVATQRSASVTVEGGDIVVELFSGSCGNLNSLQCEDASSNSEVFDYHGLNIGETYYVRVYGFDNAEQTGTDANIRIQIGTPRSVNDECVSAIELTQSAATSCGTNLTLGTVEDASQSQSGCAGTANDDVWYQFEATSTSFTVFLESGDFTLQMFEGSCGNLTSVVCRDNIVVNETFTYTNATVGTTYYLRVHSFGGTDLTGSDAEFGLCVFTTAPVPDNDDCADAEELIVFPGESCDGAISGTTNGASLSETDLLCSGINGIASVWYSFTATGPEHIVTLSSVDQLNGNDNSRSSFEVFSGTCGARTRVQCSGQLFGTNPGPVTVTGLTAGMDYLIRVVPVNPFDYIDFDICVTTPCPDSPSDLLVNNISSTSAGLSHSYPFGIARRHEVRIAGGGATVFSVTNIQSNATATGLAPDTDYEYYVIETCGGANTAIGPFTFTTCQELATGLNVTNVTGTTASLQIAGGGSERDFIVMPAGQTPVFGNLTGVVFFITTNSDAVTATGLSSNTDYDFYVGQACPETFAGPFPFTTRPSCGDVIYDTGGPSGNYGENEDYTITICPETANQSGGARRVSITFTEFYTENGFDGITIYDGEDTNAPVITSPASSIDLWSWDSNFNVGTGDLQDVTVFTTNTSGCITLRFTSDGSINFPGFTATINCDLTADIFSTILTTVPAGSGAVTADRGYLSTASGYMYYVKEGTGSLLALQLGNTQAQVPLSGVSLVAGSGASNLGQNGCIAPYVTVPDWWVMNRTWDVSPSVGPASPIGVRFLYTQEDFDAIANNSGFAGLTHEQLSFYKINGGDEEDLTAPGNACHDLVAPANYQEFDPGEYTYTDLTGGSAGTTAHQAQFEITSFSGGGGGAGTNFGGALPVEFLAFTGEAGPKFNHLTWTTVREENTAIHAVERSVDGNRWTTVGSLPAAGTSNEEIDYAFTDEHPLPTTLYRIRTTDQDGGENLSAIVSLQRATAGIDRLGLAFPNPVIDRVSLPYFGDTEEMVHLVVLDASGRRLFEQTYRVETGPNVLTVPLHNLPSGIYWLSVRNAEGDQLLRRVAKQ